MCYLKTDLHFFVKWVEEEGSFDVLNTKQVKCAGDVLDIREGDRIEGKFKGQCYPVGILAKGMFILAKCVIKNYWSYIMCRNLPRYDVVARQARLVCFCSACTNIN